MAPPRSHRRLLFLLLLAATSTTSAWGFQQPPTLLRPTGGNSRVTAPFASSTRSLVALNAAARGLVWFTPGDLRVHDHPALASADNNDEEQEDKVPLFIFDPTYLATQPPHALSLQLRAVRDLRASLQRAGGDLVVRTGQAEAVVPAVVKEAAARRLWHHLDAASTQRALVQRGLSSLPSTGATIDVRPWRGPRLRAGVDGGRVGPNYERDYLPAIGGGKEMEAPLPSSSLKFWLPEDRGRLPSFEELLELAYGSDMPATEDDPLRQARAHAAREEYWTPAYFPETVKEGEGGESLALAWLDEYLETGPAAFGQKHLPSSGEGLERQVIRRLVASKGYEGLFEGEIFTRAFSPLLGVGALSPRYLAAKLKARGGPRFLGKSLDKEVAMLEEIVERREWHEVLAERDLDHTAPVPEPLEFRYWRFHGHLVRYAVSRDEAPSHLTSNTDGTQKEKPTLLFVHGFGASSDQWAKCFKELAPDFRIFAVDLLGFGHAEKPPVTYTQYLWQDQVRDFAIEVIRSPFFIAGNSIGGFTAMSVAADIGPLCQGLVLVNTAGRVVPPEQYDAEVEARAGATIETATRTGGLGPFSGPPKALLRVVSQGLFWYLQPRVEKICKDLYKNRPEEVGERLVTNIVRDSCDPGALGVFASGGRLPTPRPANELLKKFGGPVLVAQGVLDPLNDAKGRAKLLEAAHGDVEVYELNGGHCPHDEVPEEMAAAVRGFVGRVLGKGDWVVKPAAAAGASAVGVGGSS